LSLTYLSLTLVREETSKQEKANAAFYLEKRQHNTAYTRKKTSISLTALKKIV